MCECVSNCVNACRLCVNSVSKCVIVWKCVCEGLIAGLGSDVGLDVATLGLFEGVLFGVTMFV